MDNYTAENPPAINTHVVVNDTNVGVLPRMTGWVIGHGHTDTSGGHASRGPVVLVVLDTEWRDQFTGPATVGCLPIRPEYLAPLEH
jgi:hypothetical protein